jgi:hypothetical protein
MILSLLIRHALSKSVTEWQVVSLRIAHESAGRGHIPTSNSLEFACAATKMVCKWLCGGRRFPLRLPFNACGDAPWGFAPTPAAALHFARCPIKEQVYGGLR